jgi:ribose-phosphate pyrophosphokinase
MCIRDSVIIDDICDGGRTFAELGAQLKEQGAALVFLIVTHGILSYGEEQLKPHIDHMWMTNSFRDYESEFATLLKL